MKDDAQCPYCGAKIKIDHEDGYGYEEDQIHHQQCTECFKTFIYTTTIIIHIRYSVVQADCLNNGEHQYEKISTYLINFARLRCKICGYERVLTPQ